MVAFLLAQTIAIHRRHLFYPVSGHEKSRKRHGPHSRRQDHGRSGPTGSRGARGATAATLVGGEERGWDGTGLIRRRGSDGAARKSAGAEYE